MSEEKKQIDLKKLINPSERQQEAFDAVITHDYVLYGGAMGGGKSYWIRWCLVSLLIYWFVKFGLRNVTVGLFCEDYPALEDRHIKKIQFEFPAWLGDYNGSKHEYKLRPEYGGGIISLRNLDKPSKYASAEFAAIAVDELTLNSKDKFNFLQTRMRWPGIARTKFLAGTNPGGIGHAWVKKLFMDRDFEPEELDIANQFRYIPAKASDNPHLDQNYYRTLDSLPEKMRKAYKDGNWDIFAGQYFTEWSKEIHVVEPFPIPDHWMRFFWMDYGYSAPACGHWAALDEIGRIYVYRELYGSGMTYSQFAKKVKEMTPEEERKKLDNNMIADPAVFQRKGENSNEKSGAEIMFDATGGWLNVRRGNNERVIGWGIMREYLKPFMFEGRPTAKLLYFKTCKDAVRTIPALVHDEIRPEDVNSKGEDHAGDTDRYGVMDIYETYSESRAEEKEVKTADDIFKNDMKAMAIAKDQESENTDWMNM